MRGLIIIYGPSVILIALLVTIAVFNSGCASAVPPHPEQPCGVIADSLTGVNATDREGRMRLDIHHARGRAAGCW